MEEKQENGYLKWWRDRKFLIGVILVVLSFILGFYSKVLVIVRFYEPVQVITGLSIYAFSWAMLFVGVFLVGWETVRLVQDRIHHHVKRTVSTTYHHAKALPGRSYRYTKHLHKKSMHKIKGVVGRMRS